MCKAKMIHGNQCTIACNMNDNKISHAYPNVVASVLGAIKKHFKEIVISWENQHDQLDMKIGLDYVNKHMITDMQDQLEEALGRFGEEVDSMVISPENKDYLLYMKGTVRNLINQGVICLIQ